ncbi:tyrosine-protein phosphatase 1 [Magnaporthiopsis poae ATCC 64411]|uniref:protein-tyrosine-phosphatase n=1 Tax=Magnaporthiopsis poae (strain ATCC 64411 / 73-15) TaxID=644358 RepID=A0A0C4E405_MAGP6|nr:tyrosine-protein phosphatase 1 [Magnaporthiopsis poae ATCC 64411]
MPPEQPQSRLGDCTTTHYAMMKTSSRQPSTPSQGSVPFTHSASQPFFAHKSTTPTASSPHFSCSVGQPCPPKLPLSAAGTGQRLGTSQQLMADITNRSPSPNYFGLVVEPTHDPHESGRLPRENWSPVTSSVRSFAAAIPKQLPLDANPEFEAFKRQADANRGKSGFTLSSSHFNVGGASSPAPIRPRPPRWHTHESDMSLDTPAAQRPAGAAAAPPFTTSAQQVPASVPPGGAVAGSRQPSMGRMDVDADAASLHDSAYVSGDSKRNSEASLNLPSLLNMPRYESPGQFESPPVDKRTSLSTIEDRHPRLSVTQGRPDPPTPATGNRLGRADTLPGTSSDPSSDSAPSIISSQELKDLLQGPRADRILLVDIRSQQKYAASRIQGAVNLCIPTTLLKRISFNLQKLQDTLRTDAEQNKFAHWRETSHLVVYHDTEKKDDAACLNMLRKFTSQNYRGKACILRRGFEGFSQAYPQLIDQCARIERSRSSADQSAGGGGGGSEDGAVARVIGGFTLPSGDDAGPSAFFSNIRQNTELVNGVGQMDIAVPFGLDLSALPSWLNKAAEEKNHGKAVSDMFLSIEKREQTRMRRAYTSAAAQQQLSVKSTGPSPPPVQLSGIEKGAKNRYSNILPFEHTRVRLNDKHSDGCDYINASHITSSRSHKRYISTQGPLPATFEDFWAMIWDQDVRVIVMLTAEQEGGQLKCHPYWRGKEFGPIKLMLISEKKVSLDIDKHRVGSTAPDSPANPKQTSRHNRTTNKSQLSPTAGDVSFVIVRKFALSHSSHPFDPIREITHLHYPSWPDFGVPTQPSHLLALVELANVMQRAALPLDVPSAIAAESQARPILVHCSAGCGRTGTFCTIDTVVDILKRQRQRAAKQAQPAAAARRGRAAKRREMGVKRKLEQRDSQGDVVSPTSSFQGAMDGTSSGFHFSSPPPRFPSLSRISASREGRAGSNGATGSGSDEGGYGGGAAASSYSSSLTPDELSRQHSPTASSDASTDAGLDASWMDDDRGDVLDLIAATVEDFRGQRLSMVQTLRQFVLCYETVLEWIVRMQERTAPEGGKAGRRQLSPRSKAADRE